MATAESFFEIYKEHSHRTESRNGRFTHGVFVTNNQISKYLEAFSKKGLYWFVLFNFLKKIKKRSERSVNYIWRYILFKLHKCVSIGLITGDRFNADAPYLFFLSCVNVWKLPSEIMANIVLFPFSLINCWQKNIYQSK